MTDFRRLRSVQQIASEPGSPFTEPSLRWKILKADENGLSEAIVRVGRRLYLDIDRFNDWLEERRGL